MARQDMGPDEAVAATAVASPQRGTLGEVFLTFLRLGLTSFGGPVAHLGYFRNELVLRRNWIDEAGFADLVALCQFLPGPASSQVEFSLGVLRGGGILGGLLAWCGFTLPSAVVLVLFGLWAKDFSGPLADGLLHGLKLVAVAVVAQAVWGMARNLAPDRPRAGIALAGLAMVVFLGGAVGQIGAIVLGALAGLWLCRGMVAAAPAGTLRFPVRPRWGVLALALFAILLLGPLAIAPLANSQALSLFDAFYRSGALVFGGGHVVLPLLQAQVVAPGWVSDHAFLSGYGVAQAIPGPLFTFAAYLGAVVRPPPNGLAGAVIALAGIFLPGLLLVYGMLPFWDSVRRHPSAQAAMRGTNAAVVGVLAAALYNPVWTSSVLNAADFAAAASGFVLLTVGRLPAWVVVILLALFGMASSLV